MKKHKLAILASHPIQYQAPFYKMLAKNEQIDLTVYFCSDLGLKEKMDDKFGQVFKWDIPLLEGYSCKFLKNIVPKISTESGSLINPGIVKEIFNNKYDAVLINGYAIPTNWLAFAACWLTRTPIILHGETLLTDKGSRAKKLIKKIILKSLFKTISAFLPIGTRSKEFYLLYKIPSEKMFLAPYSVNNQFFFDQVKKYQYRKQEIRKEIGVSNELPIIFIHGKLRPRKRPMDLLMAFERVQDQAALVYLGSGDSRSLLEKYIQEKNIKNVYFLGFKNYSEIPKYCSAADIFAFASEKEPWGLVLNEAMCCELPVVVSNGVSAAADLVKHEKNGYIFPKHDIDALAGYLKELISNSEKRKSMGQESLRIISSWNYEACEQTILKALKFIT